MMRDPELDQAIVELRPIFAKLRAERKKLLHEKVRNDLNLENAVSLYIRDLASEIGLRADRIRLDYDAFIAILATDANEIKRSKIGRRPSVRQMTAALEVERDVCAKNVVDTKAALVSADAKYREAVRLDAAAREACRAYTGYSN